MLKIIQYSFYDLIRSRWTFAYLGFYLILTTALLMLSHDHSKVVLSLMNIILLLAPLIAAMFGAMYYYNSREFVELLLALPLKRKSIFLGLFIGVASSLSISILCGIAVPFFAFGIAASSSFPDFVSLLLVAILLSCIFSAIAFYIALTNINKIRGFGLTLLVWLLLALIYDGLVLMALSFFSEYPLEKWAIGMTLFNPIDLGRILILLKLDISALMGYTGAVFDKFFGTSAGMLISTLCLAAWLFTPIIAISRKSQKLDF